MLQLVWFAFLVLWTSSGADDVHSLLQAKVGVHRDEEYAAVKDLESESVAAEVAEEDEDSLAEEDEDSLAEEDEDSLAEEDEDSLAEEDEDSLAEEDEENPAPSCGNSWYARKRVPQSGMLPPVCSAVDRAYNKEVGTTTGKSLSDCMNTCYCAKECRSIEYDKISKVCVHFGSVLNPQKLVGAYSKVTSSKGKMKKKNGHVQRSKWEAPLCYSDEKQHYSCSHNKYFKDGAKLSTKDDAHTFDDGRPGIPSQDATHCKAMCIKYAQKGCTCFVWDGVRKRCNLKSQCSGSMGRINMDFISCMRNKHALVPDLVQETNGCPNVCVNGCRPGTKFCKSDGEHQTIDCRRFICPYCISTDSPGACRPQYNYRGNTGWCEPTGKATTQAGCHFVRNVGVCSVRYEHDQIGNPQCPLGGKISAECPQRPMCTCLVQMKRDVNARTPSLNDKCDPESDSYFYK